MTILADTGGIIALLDSDDKHHAAVVRVTQNQELLVPATVLSEVNYLVNKYLGESVARSFLEALVDGYFHYLPVELSDIDRATKIMARYKDIPLRISGYKFSRAGRTLSN
jgi:predicted nucleic acid-binding protein